MKFLLVAINAKYIHSNPAIYSLKAYAEERLEMRDWEIALAEYTINHEKYAILKDIYKKRPDVIGFSCYIWNISLVRELITELKKLLPQVPIWLGGPEVSFDLNEQMRKVPEAFGIMFGEGEETFLELLSWYQEHGIGCRTGLDMIRICPDGKIELSIMKRAEDVPTDVVIAFLLWIKRYVFVICLL